MNLQSIIMVCVLFVIFESLRAIITKLINNRIAKIASEKDTMIAEQQKIINQQKELNSNLKLGGINFDDTKKVLMDMIDEYISFIFRNEIDMPHNIRNKSKPTTWEGVYVIPSSELQQKHYDDLKVIVREHMSESFLDRLRVFYKDSYIEKYIDQYIYTEYNRRLRLTMENAREFRDICNKNLTDYRRELEEADKKKTFSKNDKMNRLFKVFGFDPILPTNDDDATKATPFEDIDTVRLMKNRYLLNKPYFDSLNKYVKGIDDVLVDADKNKDADDKLITYMSNEYGWSKTKMTPPEVEKSKTEIIEVCLKHGLNPMQIGLFGEYNKAAPYQYTGDDDEVVSMNGRRLNTHFYGEDIYNKGYHSIVEAIHAEGFELFI